MRAMERREKATIGYGTILTLVAFAVIRTQPNPASFRTRSFPPEKAHELYATLTDGEADDRQAAVKHFRSNRWSQDDDFFAKQAKHVREYATVHGMNPGMLVDALDVGMHEHWPTPAGVTPTATVIPCRPRLTY